MSLVVSIFSIPSKCCLVELVLRYLFASPFAIANFVAGGWYEEACTKSCLLVGLMCVLTSRIPVVWNFFTFVCCDIWKCDFIVAGFVCEFNGPVVRINFPHEII